MGDLVSLKPTPEARPFGTDPDRAAPFLRDGDARHGGKESCENFERSARRLGSPGGPQLGCVSRAAGLSLSVPPRLLGTKRSGRGRGTPTSLFRGIGNGIHATANTFGFSDTGRDRPAHTRCGWNRTVSDGATVCSYPGAGVIERPLGGSSASCEGVLRMISS